MIKAGTPTQSNSVPRFIYLSALIFLMIVGMFSLALLAAYFISPSTNGQCTGELCTWSDVLGFLDIVVAIPSAVVGLVFVIVAFTLLRGKNIRQSGRTYVVLAAGLAGLLPVILLVYFLLN